MQGIFHLTRSFDTIGAMAKAPIDVAMICDILVSRGEVAAAAAAATAGPTLAEAATMAKSEELGVGFLDIEKWRLPKTHQDASPEYLAQTVGCCHFTLPLSIKTLDFRQPSESTND